MAKVIAVANHAGGVGKTKTALNLTYELAALGHRVLLVDLDPQGDVSEILALSSVYPSLARVLYEGSHTPQPVAVLWGKVGFHVLPVMLNSMAEVDARLYALTTRRERRVADALRELQGHYDYIVQDLPPSLNILATNGFYATVVSKENAVEPGSGIIIPVQSLGKAYRALPSMFRSLAIIDKYEPVTVLGMLVTIKERTSFEAYVDEQVHQNYPGLAFEATIPWRISAWDW